MSSFLCALQGHNASDVCLYHLGLNISSGSIQQADYDIMLFCTSDLANNCLQKLFSKFHKCMKTIAYFQASLLPDGQSMIGESCHFKCLT